MVGKVIKNVSCVKVLVMCCGSEELSRHRGGRQGNKECELCESVSHVLWECLTYSNSRADFLLDLQRKLGNGFERFDSLDSLGMSSFILGSEL